VQNRGIFQSKRWRPKPCLHTYTYFRFERDSIYLHLQDKNPELGINRRNKSGGVGTLWKGENLGTIYTKENNKAEKVAYAEIAQNLVRETHAESSTIHSSNNPFNEIERNSQMKSINSNVDLDNENMDVIIQAFRFVKLDSHLNSLLAQVSKRHANFMQMLTKIVTDQILLRDS
jgi:hypothetical protein